MTKRKRGLQNAGDDNGADDSDARDSSQLTQLRRPTVDVLDEFSDTASEVNAAERPRKVVRKELSHVNVCGPAYPRSVYEGWRSLLEPMDESTAVTRLKSILHRDRAQADRTSNYDFFVLNEFSIYQSGRKGHTHELCTLDRLQNRNGFSEFLFDGILTVEGERCFVQGARFSTLTIDGYGDRKVTSLHGQICIQTSTAERDDVWYQMGRPSKEYKRFYYPFVWLAQFTKHFVDYLLETKNVKLLHFRSRFQSWLCSRLKGHTAFQGWLHQGGYLQDFRTTVAAHVGFLWKECWSIDDNKTGICKHPIWGEVDHLRLNAIPERQNREARTVATPFVYKLFEDMYFSGHLESREISDQAALKKIRELKEALGLTPFGLESAPNTAVLTPLSLSGSDDPIDVEVGDVAIIEPNLESRWQNSSHAWYAYVQRKCKKDERTVLDVLWLYEPHDTTLGKAYYPFNNELFLSDNCSCGTEAIDAECVVGKANVTWFTKDPSSVSPGTLFVRQKFRTIHDQDTYDFVSLQKSDFTCSCSNHGSIFEDCRRNFQIGDCVLVKEYNSDLGETILEPTQVVDFDLEKRLAVLRRLRRKSDFVRAARPNELVLTHDLLYKAPSSVVRKCHVRTFDAAFVQGGKALPTPYDRDGTGDFFFVLKHEDDVVISDHMDNELHATESDKAVAEDYPPLEEADDIMALSMKLIGMGIFCGGGNFDRGLEDGGAVEFRYAIDWAERALHSYRANAAQPEKTQYFLGSVNDYLAQAMAGSKAANIASPGTIGLISAGSPCPGFSLLQLNRLSSDSLRNASMVASVVSFVDIYCPKYLILENVVSMTCGMGVNKDQNVFAQILAALVALGYQVQQYLADAWSSGSSQSRSRVFIVASAPGLRPLPAPTPSHAHPITRMTQKSLGKSSNGLPFGVRPDVYTPFPHISAACSTADLPDVGDSLPQLCPAFPDHRTASDEDNDSRSRIEMVPVYPRGSGLLQAVRLNRITRGEPMDFFNSFKAGSIRGKDSSRTYSRVYPNGLFPTVTTAVRIQCGITGRSLHWNQHRPLTVMELRRAQGFLDHEVIIGTPSEQVKIIGNSVDRKVAFVLGLSLRESWLQNITEQRSINAAAQSFAPVTIAKEAAEAYLSNIADDTFHLSQKEKESLLEERRQLESCFGSAGQHEAVVTSATETSAQHMRNVMSEMLALSQEDKESLLAERRLLEAVNDNMSDDHDTGDDGERTIDMIMPGNQWQDIAVFRQSSPVSLPAGREPQTVRENPQDGYFGPIVSSTEVGHQVGETEHNFHVSRDFGTMQRRIAYVRILVDV